MGNINSLRKFEYRPCRLATGFNVDFVAEGEAIHGVCKDVSDAGIRAEFDGSVTVGSSGLLILRHPTGILKLVARVAYCEKYQVGLEFLLDTPSERRMTSDFIAAISTTLTIVDL